MNHLLTKLTKAFYSQLRYGEEIRRGISSSISHSELNLWD